MNLFTLVTQINEIITSSSASLFYGLQAGSLLTLWVAVKLGSGVDFLRMAEELSNVALGPSWLSRKLFLVVLRRNIYLSVSYALIPLLAMATWCPDCILLRICVAVVATLFHLGECSRTTSHRDYLMVYNAWGLALLPETHAKALAYGLSVHFIIASGISKLFIGGPRWASPGSMQAILRTFGAKRKEEGGPMSPALNHLVCQHSVLAAACSWSTLLFECVAAPLAFVMPPSNRIILCYGMLVLHVAIALLQSGAIGAFFLPNVASYVFGLYGDGPVVGSEGWFLALGVCVTLSASVFRGRLLPEDWPLTPFALFPWSERQWATLHNSFVNGDRRMVLSADPSIHPVGLRIVPLEHKADVKNKNLVSVYQSDNLKAKKTKPDHNDAVVYDFWNRLLGVTTFQNEILEALEFDEMALPDWNAISFTCRLETWLDTSCRVIEISTGRPLIRAYWVRIEDGRVKEVICSGSQPEKSCLLTSNL